MNEGLFRSATRIGLAAVTVRLRGGEAAAQPQLSSPAGSVKWPSSRRLSPTTFVTFTNHLCPHYRLPGLRAQPSVIAGSTRNLIRADRTHECAKQGLFAHSSDHQQKYVFEKLKDYLCTDQVQRVYDYRTRGIAGICEAGVSKRVVGLF